MRGDENASGIFHDTFFQRTQRINIKVIGRFVKKNNICPFTQHFSQVNTVALTTGELPHLFLLVSAFKIKLPDISTRRHLFFAKFNNIQPVGNFFPNGFVRIKLFTRLINITQINSITNSDCTAVRLFLSGNHTEQSSFTRTIRPDDTDNSTLRNFEREIINQQAVTITFRNSGCFNNQITQTVSHRNRNMSLRNLFLAGFGQQLFIRINTRLRFCLTRFRIFANPFQFISQSPLARAFLTRFLLQTFLFLFQP